MKFNITKEDGSKSGIYKIHSDNSEYIYIGSTQNFHQRYIGHRSAFLNGEVASSKLTDFCIFIGFENLIFSIIEISDIRYLNEREQYYIFNTANVLNNLKAAKRSNVITNKTVKTFLSLDNETIEAIKKRAAALYGGNYSICARLLIETALKDITEKEQWERDTK